MAPQTGSIMKNYADEKPVYKQVEDLSELRIENSGRNDRARKLTGDRIVYAEINDELTTTAGTRNLENESRVFWRWFSAVASARLVAFTMQFPFTRHFAQPVEKLPLGGSATRRDKEKGKVSEKLLPER
ncbi:hypothetical protein K0M31_007297 [Melipona bicolor]|uniref:Uncharacterized protein n=1 Tax=Melipona bicolor TaxID=60889 RepID=A0AA40GBE1_9HYME|nr:hypothetical protein K0M31_007297 [Melipona bicolor]